jgi:hypothetical protein
MRSTAAGTSSDYRFLLAVARAEQINEPSRERLRELVARVEDTRMSAPSGRVLTPRLCQITFPVRRGMEICHTSYP